LLSTVALTAASWPAIGTTNVCGLAYCGSSLRRVTATALALPWRSASSVNESIALNVADAAVPLDLSAPPWPGRVRRVRASFAGRASQL
jgi:hypothetical protein